MTEKIRISSNIIFLKPILSEILTIHQMIENRDIGDVVATPVEEFVRAQPHVIKLTVILFSEKEPPFSAKSPKKIIKAVYNIPNIERSLITWEKVKQACGGTNGFLWGRFRATANLDNGRQMQVHAGSANEAEERLKALLKLSSAKLITLSITEEKKEGNRAEGKRMYKETTRVYPAYMTIINSQKIIDESNRETYESKTRVGVAGTFRRERTVKIPLWIEKAPSNYNQILNEAFKNRGDKTSQNNSLLSGE